MLQGFLTATKPHTKPRVSLAWPRRLAAPEGSQHQAGGRPGAAGLEMAASIGDLPTWARIVAGLTPVKRNMHMIGLLTGLRWETLKRVEVAWITGNQLTVPPDKMKARRGCALPLSTALIALVGRAKAAAAFVALAALTYFHRRPVRPATCPPTTSDRSKQRAGPAS